MMVTNRKGNKRLKLIKALFMTILIILGLAAVTAGYAFAIEPSITVTHEYKLNENTTEADTKLKVVQLSDIQVNETYTVDNLNKLVKKVNNLTPDIIVFTGDLFDNYAKNGPVRGVTDALSNLNAVYGKYAVWGNRDYGGGASRVYEQILIDSGFTLLTNQGENILLENGSQIFIGGIDDYLLGEPDIEQTLQGMSQDSDYNILLVHEPDAADLLAESGANLILSGHSHGGQVRIPFVEELKNEMAKKYTKGFYTINEEQNMKLYVNTGIGTSHIPVRFMVPPEIAVFDIRIS